MLVVLVTCSVIYPGSETELSDFPGIPDHSSRVLMRGGTISRRFGPSDILVDDNLSVIDKKM